MAKPILVANWKNHPSSISEAESLIKKIIKDRALYKKLSLAIAPPAPYFELVSDRVGNFAKLASQDLSLVSGTRTGEVTLDILKSFGVRIAIIGHSERRNLGESSEEVSQKVRLALRSGITPLVCVGEEDFDTDGEHFEFLRRQIKQSLSSLGRRADLSRLAIAYEPAWAIGKRAKNAMSPLDLSQSVIFIRKVLVDMFTRATAESVPILYGGSVEPANAEGLFRGTGIRGFLVGHTSLEARAFRAVAETLISK